MQKTVFLILLAVLAFSFYGCRNDDKSAQETTEMEQTDFGLLRVNDLEDLRSLVQAEKNDSLYVPFADAPGARSGNETEAVKEESSGYAETGTLSQTNNQVDGVDEGDIVKSDAKRIYSITDDYLNVVEILGEGKMEIALRSRSDAAFDGYYTDLYITDRYLVVIGYHYNLVFVAPDGEAVRNEPGTIIHPSREYFNQSMTLVEIYNIDTLKKVDEIEISGHLLTSRLIENDLYLVSNQAVYFNDHSDPRPLFRQGEDLLLPEFNDIMYLPDMPYRAYTIITHIHLEDTVDMDHDIFLGDQGWGHIYVSHEGIYLASTIYEYTHSDRYIQRGKLVSYVFENDGVVRYGGAGEYAGHVLNQFSMDEYNGIFRMVTTEGWGDAVKNRLYIFERQTIDGKHYLKVIGLMDEGLGKPRETVRSVRFVGERATVVTFEQIDPFYVIDLSDPENPTILGALEIPGFSTYQHPWKGHLILGIGYEAEESRINGIRLSLYDISDESAPVEVGLPLVLLNEQNGWQFGEALHNHKAILIAKDYDFIGFSISRYHWFSSQYKKVSEYIVFHIDEKRAIPVEIAAKISHMDILEENQSLFDGYLSNNWGVDRAVYIDAYLYVVSGEAVTSHAIEDAFETLGILAFRSGKIQEL